MYALHENVILASGLGVLAASLLTTFSSIGGIETALVKAANESLATAARGQVFEAVEVKFSGQEATLTGEVPSETAKAEAEKVVRENVRLGGGPGSGLNPVIAVHNLLKIASPPNARLPTAVPSAVVPAAPKLEVVIPPPPVRVITRQDTLHQAYLGWSSTPGHIHLFGKVPNEFLKTKVIAAAVAAFPTATKINTEKLLIEPGYLAPDASDVVFGNIPDLTKPQLCFGSFGKALNIYPYSAFDSELAADFPELGLVDGELSFPLEDFRAALIQFGTLKTDAPYLSITRSGQTLILVGEVASAEAKTKFLTAIAAANPSYQLMDQLTVTPLVAAVADIEPTLLDTPVFLANESAVAVATPGQKWRRAVVHAIYFSTGSDRSKDQERALYQIRRLLKIKPDAQFEIVGHTDNVGAIAANTTLSQGRADTFAGYLKAARLSLNGITTRGAGPAEPIADNGSSAGQALNRRVDVLLK
jgi:outer membrane protein OmpA-like peptidoglycan-associated protein